MFLGRMGSFPGVLAASLGLLLTAAVTPASLSPLAPQEAAASLAWDSCTGFDRTLSVRADGGRDFVCGKFPGFENASASCGTLTPAPYPYGTLFEKFESGSCLGPVTFSWESQGTPYVQNMDIEP